MAAIAAAFDGIRLGDGVSLHEADAIDSYALPQEQAAARARDKEIDWRQVPHQSIERLYCVWSYFDAKGCRFYLPAGMTWGLEALTREDANLTSLGSLIWALWPRGLPSEDFLERFRLLTDSQTAAVRQFLQWVAENGGDFADDAQQALDQFWGKSASV